MRLAVPASLLLALVVALLVAPGCGKNSFTGPGPEIVVASLTLHTAAGVQANVFQSGEEFEARFVLSNLTRNSFCYTYAPPETEFRIYRGDSLLASSVEGLTFPAVLRTDCVESGKGITRSWTAPSPATRSPKLVLTPGTYRLTVNHASYLGTGGVLGAAPATFTIEP